MSKIELYINGDLADFDESLTMALQSNFLQSLDKMTNSFTYTARLPRTAHNEALVSSAGLVNGVGAGAVFARRYMTIDYIVDGVALIEQGRGYILTATNSDYEISVIFNEITPLKTMIAEALQLPKLGVGDDWFRYSDLETLDTVAHFKALNYGHADYSTGWNVKYGRLPVVPVGYILNQICDKYGWSFVMNDMERFLQLRSWAVALVSRKHALDEELPVGSIAHYWTREENPDYDEDNPGMIPEHIIVEHKEITDSAYACIYAEGDHDTGTVYIRLRGKGTARTVHLTGHSSQPFHVVPIATATFGTTPYYAQLDTATGSYKLDATLPDEVTIESGTALEWLIYNNSGTPITDRLGTRVDVDYTLEMDGDVIEGQGYRIAPNLPAMTCVDFIKELCARLGVFPVYTGHATEVTFMSVEEVLAGAPWEIELATISSLSYSVKDWARQNRFVHDTDESYTDEKAGSIDIDNETLEATKTQFASKFVSGVGRVVTLYTMEQDGSTWKPKKLGSLKPRFGKILHADEDTTSYDNVEAIFSFDGMDFQSLLEKNSAALATLVERGRVIKGSAILRPAEAQNIDFTRPIYDRTTQRRYVAISATSGANNLWTFELIQIED